METSIVQIQLKADLVFIGVQHLETKRIRKLEEKWTKQSIIMHKVILLEKLERKVQKNHQKCLCGIVESFIFLLGPVDFYWSHNM